MNQFMWDLYLLLKELHLVRFPSDVYLVVIGFQIFVVFLVVLLFIGRILVTRNSAGPKRDRWWRPRRPGRLRWP
jgi:hypothetical protein